MTARRFFATLRMTILVQLVHHAVNELLNIYRNDGFGVLLAPRRVTSVLSEVEGLRYLN